MLLIICGDTPSFLQADHFLDFTDTFLKLNKIGLNF